jgi:hypothetical protein
MNALVVVARFDEEKDKQIMNLRKVLSNEGYSVPDDWPLHITIAAYENLDEKLVCEWTEEFALNHEKIKIGLNSLSLLPPGGEHTETAVICLAPAYSKPFVDFYYDFHEKYEEYCTGVGRFNSITHGNPVIHSTIAIIKVKEMQGIMELVFSQNIFGETEIRAIEVYSVNFDEKYYPRRLIRRFELI